MSQLKVPCVESCCLGGWCQAGDLKGLDGEFRGSGACMEHPSSLRQLDHAEGCAHKSLVFCCTEPKSGGSETAPKEPRRGGASFSMFYSQEFLKDETIHKSYYWCGIYQSFPAVPVGRSTIMLDVWSAWTKCWMYVELRTNHPSCPLGLADMVKKRALD